MLVGDDVMMTTVEILKEIKKLPYGKRREISKELEYILKEENRDSREREMAEHLFEQGIIDQYPITLSLMRNMTRSNFSKLKANRSRNR